MDFREKDLYGIGSLQIVVSPSGFFYADIDRFDAYNFPGGFIGHLAAEVLAPIVERFFQNLGR